MKKQVRRSFALLLSLLMLFGCFPTAFAEEGLMLADLDTVTHVKLETTGVNGIVNGPSTTTFGEMGTILVRYIVDYSTGTEDSRVAYCIQHGVETQYPESYTPKAITELYGSEIAGLIGDVLAVGFGGTSDNLWSADEASKWAATQLAVWEVTRSGVTADTWHTAQSEADINTILNSSPNPTLAKQTYKSIVDQVIAKHKKPSFNGETVTLKWDGTKYTATLTDTNGVLKDFSAYSANGLTFAVNGNTLTISSTEAFTDTVSASASKSAGFGGSAAAVGWIGEQDPSLQWIATYSGSNSGSVTSTVKINCEAAVFDVTLTKTSANVSITNGNSNYSLEGAVYNVYEGNVATGTPVATFTTDTNGKATLSTKLHDGDYAVKEVKAPKGYVLDPTTYKINISGGNLTLDVVDDPGAVLLTVVKKDSDSKTSVAAGNASLAGAVYRITYQQNGTTATKDITTNENGIAALGNIPLGKITVQEIKAPVGYKLDTRVYTYNITEITTSAVYELEPADDFLEEVYKGKIQIHKQYETISGTSANEQNAEFQIYLKSAGSYANAKATERDTITTNTSGIATSKDLPYGTYVVHQSKGGAGREKVADFEVNISEDGKTYTYERENKLIRGKFKIKKTSEDGKVSGVQFRVTRLADNYNKVYTTGSDGTILTEELPIYSDLAGTTKYQYKIEEVNTSSAYVEPESQTVMLQDGSDTSVTFSNVLKKFRVTVKKTDALTTTAQGDASLAGAVYGLYDNGRLVKEYTTDANGSFTTDYYVCGDKWTIKEITASPGYTLDSTTYEVGASAGDFTIEKNNVSLSVKEQIKLGGLSIQKLDNTTGKIPQGNASLAGIQFQIINNSTNAVTVNGTSYAKGKVITTLTTDANGYAATANNLLPYGTYIIRETKTNASMQLTAADVIAEVRNSGTVHAYEAKDNVVRGGIAVQKLDSITGQTPQGGASLAGIEFQIINNSTNAVTVNGTSYAKGKTVMTITTDENGYAATGKNDLPYGNYIVHESKTNTSMLLTAEDMNVTVSENGKLYSVEAENDVVRGALSVQKLDSITGKTPQGNADFSGIQFQIINNSTNPVYVGGKTYSKGEVVLTITTNASGVALTDDKALPYGDYILRESKTNESMLLTAGDIAVEVRKDGTRYSFEAEDDVVRGGVKIEKRDLEAKTLKGLGAASLDGTTFKITNKSTNAVIVDGLSYAPNAEIMTLTIKDGKAQTEADALPYGKYEIVETAVGTGYLLTDGTQRTFEIKKNGEFVEYTEDLSWFNQVKRGDLQFVKAAEDTMHRMANVPFKLTSQTTGESHILVTDENGEVRTTAEWNEHTYKTNYNDTAAADAYDSYAGVWFGLAPDGNMTKANNSLGALPYDVYTLEELPCDANEGYTLVTIPNITISRNNVCINLGTIDDTFILIPAIGTSAADEADNDSVIYADADAAIVDTVEYGNLTIGTKYKLKGVLMDKSTGEKFLIDGNEITAEKEFTATRALGTIDMKFVFDARKLDGHDIVVFEYLSVNGNVVAEHADIDDEGQTVRIYEPKIGTSAAVDGENVLDPIGEVTLTDTVSYENLVPGRTYKVSGVLMDKSTGEKLLIGGEEVTAETEFTPTEAAGTVKVEFTFTAFGLNGKSIVVFETLTRNGNELAVHADINDAGQTIQFRNPQIGTSAAVDGEKIVDPLDTVTLTDTVTYSELTAGKMYKLTGVLMDKSTGEKLLIDGEEVTASKVFTARETTGTVAVEFTFDASDLNGKEIVVFEKLYRNDEELAKHEDINDVGQTIKVNNPQIGTSAAVDGEKITDPLKEVTLTDTVTYSNLTPNKEYTVTGVLMDKATGEKLLINGKEVVSSAQFTPAASSGTVEVEFAFDAAGIHGAEIVVFETLYRDDTELAVHTDITDEAQTVKVRNPEIGTSAEVDGGKEIDPLSEITIKDTVSFADLTPGEEYTVTGVLMNKATGEKLLVNGEEVTAEQKFIPADTEGTVEVTFTFSAVDLQGAEIVVFEKLYRDNTELAVHTDIDDEGQTIRVRNPEITTSATVDAGKEIDPLQTITVVDLVTYTDLTPGKEYTVTGVLMNKATGEKLLVNGKEVISSAKFTPTETDGVVEMTFAFNAVDLQGAEVVVFETLYRDTLEIAVHADINDEAQTIRIRNPEIGTTAAADGAKEIDPLETVTVKDSVAYSDLTPGVEYKLTGVLMDKSTGKKLLIDGKEVTSEKTFTPNVSSGTVEVEFAFDATGIHGKELVVFESLYRENVEFAAHTDLADKGQTIRIREPEIGTSAAADGAKEIDPMEKVTLIDTVIYTDLTPGKEYKLTGVLMNKATGEKLLINGKEVTSSAKFTPTKTDGVVEMTFVFNAVDLPGAEVVVFETLYRDTLEIAVHADIKDADQTVTVTPLHGSVSTVKIDEEFPNTGLAGAVFNVYRDTDANGSYNEDTDLLIGTMNENANGTYTLEDLLYGSYLIHEEEAPTGFLKDNSYYPFTITTDGQHVAFEVTPGEKFPNKPIKGSVTTTKVNADDPTDKITGATFGVYADANGDGIFDAETDKLVGTLNEADTGVYTLDGLRYGKYLIHEDAAPEGFVKNDIYYPFEIIDDGQIVSFESTPGAMFPNKPVKGSVTTTKVNADDPTDKITGAVFSVYEDVNKNGTYEAETDTVFGQLIEIKTGVYRLDEITYGNYLLHEDAAPEGFVQDVLYYPFAITVHGEIVEFETTPGAMFPNKPIKGSVTTTKVNADDPTDKITGATFDVYADVNENGKFDAGVDKRIDSLSETKTGVYRLDGLKYGSYLLYEYEAPEGFVRDTNYYPFTITVNGQLVEFETTPGAMFPNKPIKGSVTTTKVNADDPEDKLKGAVFAIYTDLNGNGFVDEEDTKLGTMTEIETGLYRMDDLPYGAYLIHEEAAPAGFVLDNNYYPFEIIDDGQIVDFEVSPGAMFPNKPKPPVPITGDNSNLPLMIIIVAAALSGLSITILIANRRKHTK